MDSHLDSAEVEEMKMTARALPWVCTGLVMIGALAFSQQAKLASSTQPDLAAERSVMPAPGFDPVLTPQNALENNFNRPGSDYRDYEISNADPNRCNADCMSDPTCKAFTYVRPGIQGPNAHCWLKNAVPDGNRDNCCVSGVKSGGSSVGGLEVDVDLRGSDYRDFEMRDNNPNQCRDACQNDSRCRAFTYLRPSYRGPNAHCFLKDSVPQGTADSCCISGVLRPGGGGNTQIVWQYVGTGDCGGSDIGESPGFTPNNKQPSIQPGYTAVCWDGKTYGHNNGRVFCTYKSIAPERCTGGSNRGVMYKAVLQSVAASGGVGANPGLTQSAPQGVTEIGWGDNPAQHSRGQNGKRITYYCRAVSDSQNLVVYGTDIYTDDSGVCNAAVQVGLIKYSGGTVTIEIRPGQNAYTGSTRNGITSESYGYWLGSFVFVR
jgi:hypothetical protein